MPSIILIRLKIIEKTLKTGYNRIPYILITNSANMEEGGQYRKKESSANTKKGKRKVQGVPQSQTAALPRHQEEKENRQNETSTNRTNVRKAIRLAL